jgi:uncharacterized membrane protein
MEKGGAMLKVEAGVEIARPLEEVFAFASEVDNLSLWLTGVIEANQITEGPLREGSQLEHVLHFLGRRFRARFETTEYESNRRMAFRTISGPIDMETTLSFEPVAVGTRVNEVVEGDPRSFFKVAELVLVRIVRRQLEGSLENLKDLLEGGQASR